MNYFHLFSLFFFSVFFLDSRDFLIFKATHLPNHRFLVVAIQISVIMPSPVHSTPLKGRISYKHILLRFRQFFFYFAVHRTAFLPEMKVI